MSDATNGGMHVIKLFGPRQDDIDRTLGRDITGVLVRFNGVSTFMHDANNCA